MANVSSSNGLEKYPKLRFKGFSEPWNAIRFGDIVDEYSDRTKEENEDILLSAAIEGMFLNSELFDHQRGASNKGYKKIDMGTLVLSTQNLHLGNANVNLRFEHGMVSPAYKTYHIHDCSIKLIAELVKSDKAKRFFYNATTVGASVCRRNVEWDTLYDQPLYLPSSIEQECLATFLSALSSRINKQTELVEHLKKYKRGVSEQLFEQIKSKSAQHAFSSVFVLLQNNTFSRELLTNDETEIQNIHYGDVLIKYGSSVNIDMDDVPYIKSDAPADKFAPESYLMSGDIVIADTAEDYTVGKATEIINPNNKKILSGLHTIPCRPVMSFAPMFMGYYLNSSSFRSQIMPLIQGTKVSSIGKAQLMKTTVYIPPIDEQKRIADLLYSIDTKINLLSETADKMKQLKSAMLQQLFI